MRDRDRTAESEAEMERLNKAIEEAKQYVYSRPKSNGNRYRIFCIIAGLLVIALEVVKAVRAGSMQGVGEFAMGCQTGILLAIGLEWYGKATSTSVEPISGTVPGK